MPIIKGNSLVETECKKYNGELITSIVGIEKFITTLEKNNLDSIYLLNQKLLCSSFSLNYQKGIAEACNNIGYYHYTNLNLTVARSFILRAQTISKAIGYIEGIAASHSYIGLISQQIHDYDNALIHFKKLYELGLKEKNIGYHADGLINMGKIHLLGKNYADAKSYLEESIEVLKPLGNITSLGWAYAHLGKLYAEQGDIDKAYKHFIIGNDIMIENNYELWSNFILNDIGALYAESEPEKSFKYYKKALELSKDNHSYIQSLESYFLIGDYYLNKNKYQNAKKEFLNVYKLSSNVSNLEFQEKSTKRLASIFSIENNILEANKFFKLNNKFKELMFEAKEKETFSWLAAEREMLRIEHNNSILTSENQSKTQKIGLQKKVNFLLTIVVLLFLTLILALYNILKNRRKINVKLNDVNKTLTESLKTIKQQAEEISESNKTLKQQKNFLESDLKNKLLILSANQSQMLHLSKSIKNSTMENAVRTKLISVLRATSNQDILSNIDAEYFNLNKDYFKILCDKHPNLTANNLKFCSYLKMNLSSKEIASLLYISVNSVKVARSRLRKRFDIAPEGTLVAYLNSLDLPKTEKPA